MKINQKQAFWLILLSAFALRFIGTSYGLPNMYNSDEPFNVVNALAYGAKKSLEPTYFVYPALYSYLLAGVYGLYYVVGSLFGIFENAIDFGAAYFIDPSGIFLWGRILSLLLGTATVALVYRTGLKFFNQTIAVLASVILTLSYVHTDLSHWILLEATLTFFCALAIYFILAFYKEPSAKFCVLAAIVCGLAISTKYNAAFIVLSLIVAIIMQTHQNPAKLAGFFGLSFVGIGAGFLVGSPYWLIEPSAYLDTLNYTLSHVSTGMVGHQSFMPLVWPFWEIIAKDWTVGLLMVAGFFQVFFRRDKRLLVLLPFVLVSLLVIGFWSRTGVHYLAPVFPALAIYAAFFLDEILRMKFQPALKAALLAVLFIPPFAKIMHYDFALLQIDTRTNAKSWIEANVPLETMIAYENYVYGPNLFDPARFIKNSDENALLPLALKERILEESLRRKTYKLINLRKDFRLKVLADSNAVEDEYIRQLLETRLPKLSSVQKAGVPYIMVSSDNYVRYFETQPPEEEGQLWLAYMNGRRFYESVFESKYLRLVKEFTPTFWNLGPTIKIYQILPGEE